MVESLALGNNAALDALGDGPTRAARGEMARLRAEAAAGAGGVGGAQRAEAAQA